MFLVSVVCVVVLVCGGVMHARMCDVVHRICEVSLQWWCGVGLCILVLVYSGACGVVGAGWWVCSCSTVQKPLELLRWREWFLFVFLRSELVVGFVARVVFVCVVRVFLWWCRCGGGSWSTVVVSRWREWFVVFLSTVVESVVRVRRTCGVYSCRRGWCGFCGSSSLF